MYGKLPGPGHYKDRQFGSNIDGGRFSTASPLNFRQEAERRSEQLPAPWDYHIDSNLRIKGAKISTANPKNDVDWSIWRAQQIPGPGQYETHNSDFDASRTKHVGAYIGYRFYDPMYETPKTNIFPDNMSFNNRVNSMGKQADSMKRSKPISSFDRKFHQERRNRTALHLQIAKRMEDARKRNQEIRTKSLDAISRVEKLQAAKERKLEKDMIMELRGIDPDRKPLTPNLSLNQW